MGLAAAALLAIAVAPQIWRGVEKLTSPALDDVVSPAVSQAAAPAQVNWDTLKWQTANDGHWGDQSWRKDIKFAVGGASYDGYEVIFTFYLDAKGVSALRYQNMQASVERLLETRSLTMRGDSGTVALDKYYYNDMPPKVEWLGPDGEGRWVCSVTCRQLDPQPTGLGTAELKLGLIRGAYEFADITLTAPLDARAGASKVRSAVLGVKAPLAEKATVSQKVYPDSEKWGYINREVAFLNGSLELDSIVVRPKGITIPFTLNLGSHLTVDSLIVEDAMRLQLRVSGSNEVIEGQFATPINHVQNGVGTGLIYFPVQTMPLAGPAEFTLLLEHAIELDYKKIGTEELVLGKGPEGTANLLIGEPTKLATIPFQLP